MLLVIAPRLFGVPKDHDTYIIHTCRPLTSNPAPPTRLKAGARTGLAGQGRIGAPEFVFLLQGKTLGHDQLFKALLEKFFRDFLELFFPKVAGRLDFGTLVFLDKELFADLPQGPTREVDVVARLETHEGELELVLVHVEVQSRPEKDFARRMFEYSALLWLRDRAPIFPVVLYLQGGKGPTDEEWELSLFGRELFRFRYASVGLAGLRAEEYVETRPLGVALAAPP